MSAASSKVRFASHGYTGIVIIVLVEVLLFSGNRLVPQTIANENQTSQCSTGRGHTVEALPIDRTLEIFKRHNALGR
jgi:hypothetical protein